MPNKNIKLFTPEEIEILRANPYTLSVTTNSIRFTLDFKQTFWVRRQAGERVQAIFEDLGYDLGILGEWRVRTIPGRIRKEALSETGLHENNRHHNLKTPYFSSIPQDAAVVRMQHEILYLRQELEFIKKIIKQDNSKGPRQ